MKKVLALITLFSTLLLNAGEKKETVKPGEMLSGIETYVKMNTTVTADISFKKFEGVEVGRGEENVCVSYWLTIDKDKVTTKWFDYRKNIKEMDTQEHGLKIKKNLKVVIEFAEGRKAEVTLTSGKKSVKIEVPWNGGGKPFVKNTGTKDIQASVDLVLHDLNKPVWLYGDSYINWLSKNRWPYYVYNDDIRNIMYDHISGGNSIRLLRAFKTDLTLGTPKYAVWCLGMNDPRDDKGLSEQWLKCVEEFISICKEKGITPILSTTPSVPKRNHALKTKWVRESGYIYIDFAAAVNPDGTSQWPEGFLYKDGVHPANAGAKALGDEVIKILRDLK